MPHGPPVAGPHVTNRSLYVFIQKRISARTPSSNPVDQGPVGLGVAFLASSPAAGQLMIPAAPVKPFPWQAARSCHPEHAFMAYQQTASPRLRSGSRQVCRRCRGLRRYRGRAWPMDPLRDEIILSKLSGVARHPLAVGKRCGGVLFTDRHTTLPAGVGGRGGPPRGTEGDLRGRSVALG